MQNTARRDAARAARRMWTLFESVHVVTYFAAEARSAFQDAGLRGFWRGYFAGRAAPLGAVAAAPVTASFFNFAPPMVARALPGVWELITPQDALAVRSAGAVAALRRLLGDDTSSVTAAADMLLRATDGLDCAGRVLAAANAALPVPAGPAARLWHAATLLREHRGDGHIAALVVEGIGGTQAHVLHALSENTPAEKFGRVHHLAADRLARVVDGMRARGLIDASGWLSDAGRETKERIESVTDDLAAAAYSGLEASELDQLIVDLEPVSTTLDAAGSR
jgi:hypothetical protein